MGLHNINSYAVKVNGTEKITMGNRVFLRKIPQPISIQQPLKLLSHLQGPGMSSELGADVNAGQQGVASGSQEAGGGQATPGVVTRTGTGRAPNTGINQGNGGSELNAGSIDPDRACDMIMNVAAGMDNPGMLRVLRKLRGPEPEKFADV